MSDFTGIEISIEMEFSKNFFKEEFFFKEAFTCMSIEFYLSQVSYGNENLIGQ